MNEKKDVDFYKKFYEENRISLLQYESLRKNFGVMIDKVLGDDYYNMAMDVYDADRICCEDITRKANRILLSKLFNT
jgi:hypothetical protein